MFDETVDGLFFQTNICIYVFFRSSAENVPIYAINSKRAQLLQLDRFWDLQALRESEDDCDFNGLLSDFSLTMVLFDQVNI